MCTLRDRLSGIRFEEAESRRPGDLTGFEQVPSAVGVRGSAAGRARAELSEGHGPLR